MKHFVYILYSETVNRFYIGETFHVGDRLLKHNEHFFEHSFTKIAVDWEIFFVIECDNSTVARKIERHIKNMKSRTYILNLKLYPDISRKLVEKYTYRA